MKGLDTNATFLIFLSVEIFEYSSFSNFFFHCFWCCMHVLFLKGKPNLYYDLKQLYLLNDSLLNHNIYLNSYDVRHSSDPGFDFVPMRRLCLNQFVSLQSLLAAVKVPLWFQIWTCRSFLFDFIFCFLVCAHFGPHCHIS